MTEVSQSSDDDIEALRARFDAVDCSDKRAVLLWFGQIFTQCAQVKQQMPRAQEVLECVKRELGLMPDEDVPDVPPKGDIEAWMAWMVVVCLNTLSRTHEDFYLYYRVYADIIRMQLIERGDG